MKYVWLFSSLVLSILHSFILLSSNRSFLLSFLPSFLPIFLPSVRPSFVSLFICSFDIHSTIYPLVHSFQDSLFFLFFHPVLSLDFSFHHSFFCSCLHSSIHSLLSFLSFYYLDKIKPVHTHLTLSIYFQLGLPLFYHFVGTGSGSMVPHKLVMKLVWWMKGFDAAGLCFLNSLQYRIPIPQQRRCLFELIVRLSFGAVPCLCVLPMPC